MGYAETYALVPEPAPVAPPVNIAILLSEIDTYEAENDCTRIVPSILDGSHPYHKYVSNAIAWSASSGGAEYYTTTMERACLMPVPFYSVSMAEAAIVPSPLDMVDWYSSTSSDFLDVDLFISSFDMNLSCQVQIARSSSSIHTGEDPEERLVDGSSQLLSTFLSARAALSDVLILNHILMLLNIVDRLLSHLVSNLWCTVVTQYTHRTVYFRLPGDWQWGNIDHDVVALWVAIYELAFLLFVSRWDVAHMVRKIVQVNWIYRSTCFFRHVLPNVSVLEIRSTECLPVNVSRLPYPFMVPSSVTDLTLDGCSLCMHSLEGMMSPDMRLVSLSFFNVYHGFLLTPSDPTAVQRRSWHDLTGVDTFRIRDYIMPAPPIMRRLRMDLSVSPIDLPMFHDSFHESFQSVPADELILNQVFHTASAVSAADAYLHSWEVLPSADRYSSLSFLDIKVIGMLYPLLEQALGHVSNMLTELVLHLVDPSVMSGGRFSLTSLAMLSHLSVYTTPRTLGVALSAVATWNSPNKADRNSSFVSVVVMEERNADLLHHLLVFGSIQPVLVGSTTGRRDYFGGDMYILLNTPLPISRMELDIDTVDTLLTDLISNPIVKARVFPSCTLFNDSIDMVFMHELMDMCYLV